MEKIRVHALEWGMVTSKKEPLKNSQFHQSGH